MFTLLNADYDEDDQEMTDPREIAELFAAIAAVAIEACGAENARVMFEAVVEMEGRSRHERLINRPLNWTTPASAFRKPQLDLTSVAYGRIGWGSLNKRGVNPHKLRRRYGYRASV